MDIRQAVFEQLSELRQVGLTVLDDPRHDGLQIPLLEQAAATLPEYRPGLPRSAAITMLLECEVAKVKAPGHSKWLAILFGLDPEHAGLPPRELRSKAARAAGDTVDNFKYPDRREDQALRSLAAQIVADFPTLGADLPASNPLYVERTELHTAFRELDGAGAKVIVLLGQAGMGKSWLAEALTRERLPAGVVTPFIRIVNGHIFSPDLQSGLSAYGLDTGMPLGTSPPEHLARLLCADNHPTYVILDNLQSTRELQDILPTRPHATHATVVATCRTKDNSMPDHYQVLRVGKMSQDETLQVIERRSPDIDSGDAESLARAIDGHPLLARHVCGLLALNLLTAEQAQHDLKKQTIAVIDRVLTGSGDSLLAVLRATVALLQRQDDLAFELLVCCAFKSSVIAGVSQDFLLQYAKEVKAAGATSDFAHSMQLLLDLGIVEEALTHSPEYIRSVFASDGLTPPPVVSKWTCIGMHSLTMRSILLSQISSSNLVTAAKNALAVHDRAERFRSGYIKEGKAFDEVHAAYYGEFGNIYGDIFAILSLFLMMARRVPGIAAGFSESQLHRMERQVAIIAAAITDYADMVNPTIMAWVKETLA